MKRLLLLLLGLLLATAPYLQAQDDNPYARFGHKGKVLKTPQERQQFMLKIPNPDATSEIALVGIAPNEGKYYLFDAANEVIREDTLMDDELSRFLSVDPLTRSYPWYTPYQFAGNKPIRFIDVDGLEEGEPMTGAKHRSLLRLNGYYPGIGNTYWPYNKVKGRSLEKAFMTSFNFTDKKKEVTSRIPGVEKLVSTYPDVITGSSSTHFNWWGRKADISYFPMGAFYEVKARSYTYNGGDGTLPLTRQIEGMMRALAAQRTIDGRRKATEEGAAFFTLVTYSDVKISKDIIDLANELDIHLYRTKAYYSDETGMVDFSPFERASSRSTWEIISTLAEDYEEEMTADAFMALLYALHKPVPFDWEDAEKNAGLSNEEANDKP